MSNPHTPLPWRVFGIKNADTGELFYVACSPSDKPGALANGLSKENAELIVRAVNSHAVLVEALREIAAFDDRGANEHLAKTGSYGAFDEPGAVETARAALAQLDKP
jgi:hypothetical protein